MLFFIILLYFYKSLFFESLFSFILPGLSNVKGFPSFPWVFDHFSSGWLIISAESYYYYSVLIHSVNMLLSFYCSSSELSSLLCCPLYIIVPLSFSSHLPCCRYLNAFISVTSICCFVFIVPLFVSTEYVNIGLISDLYIFAVDVCYAKSCDSGNFHISFSHFSF